MHSLNYDFREVLHELRKDLRLYTFMSYYLHANIRLRSFPTEEDVMEETGLAKLTVRAGIKWLVESKAMIFVPKKHRVGVEAKVPTRRNVYQLTGVMFINNRPYPYLYMQRREDVLDLAQYLTDIMQGDGSLADLLIDHLLIHSLPVNGSPTDPYSIYGSNGKGSSGKTTPAYADKLVEEVEASPIWKAYAAGWNKQPLPPEVNPDSAHMVLVAIEKIQTAIQEKKYTLEDITACTREKLALPRKGLYKLEYLGRDIPAYLANKAAEVAQAAKLAGVKASSGGGDGAFKPFEAPAPVEGDNLTREEKAALLRAGRNGNQ